MNVNEEHITQAMRRYLAEIYRLQHDHTYVPLSTLAEAMDHSLQSTSRMLRRLKETGLVEHFPYKGVRLTPEGEQLAYPVIRRHRLVEVFLVKVMGFDWADVHDLADVMVEGINDVLEERIDEMTGFPQRCPHGEPIPDREGRLPPVNDKPLSELPEGTRGRISRVRTHNPDLLRYFGKLGLYPGTPVTLVRREILGCPVRLVTERQEHVLGATAASVLWVEVESVPGSQEVASSVATGAVRNK